MNYTLSIGDVATSGNRTKYTCLGLGSCIGLFIQDRLTGLTGGAHIFLPDADHSANHISKFCSAPHAIQEILQQLKSKGSTLEALRAKVTGGANVMGSEVNMGERNARSVLTHLVNHRIYIAAADLGGVYSRSAIFCGITGSLTIRTPQLNHSKTL